MTGVKADNAWGKKVVTLEKVSQTIKSVTRKCRIESDRVKQGVKEKEEREKNVGRNEKDGLGRR